MNNYLTRLTVLLFAFFVLIGCGDTADTPNVIVLPTPTPGALPLLAAEELPLDGDHPTLADVWDRTAGFVIEEMDTGLPMGESETIIMSSGEWWSYVHASDRSAGVVDQCGDPVAFPGCTVIYKSTDSGMSFDAGEQPTCQLACHACPCDSEIDHIDQQQYPDLFYYGPTRLLYMVYEYRGQSKLWSSADGENWSNTQHVAGTGVWGFDYQSCDDDLLIGDHPFEEEYSDCLAGGPPGIYVEGDTMYIFVAMGKNPGKLGCFKGSVHQPTSEYERCDNILLYGAGRYGDPAYTGNDANIFFDFKTLSSAEVTPIGSGADRRYYMLYEGVRGPREGDGGDTQFGVGLARSKTAAIDGEWEKYPGNPLLIDLPGNIGIGHSDIVVEDGITYMYTSLNGTTRSRLRVAWQNQ